MELIKWLNNNAGAVNTIYVMATLVLVWLTTKTVNEAKKSRESHLLPNIIPEFCVIRDSISTLSFVNHGGSAAHHLRIWINEEFISSIRFNKHELKALSHASMTLAPGQRLHYILGGVADFDKLPQCQVHYEYWHKIAGKKVTFVEDRTEFDIPSFKGSLLMGSDISDVGNRLEKRLQHLQQAIKHVENQLHWITNIADRAFPERLEDDDTLIVVDSFTNNGRR